MLSDAKSTVVSTTAGTKYTVTAYVRSSRAKVTAKLRVLEKNSAGNATYSVKRKLKKTSWYKLTLNSTAAHRFHCSTCRSVSRDQVAPEALRRQCLVPAGHVDRRHRRKPHSGSRHGSDRLRRVHSSAPAGGTVLGASVSMTSTIWLADALADRDSRFGKIAAVRIWDQDPAPWSAYRLNALQGRTLIISFRRRQPMF